MTEQVFGQDNSTGDQGAPVETPSTEPTVNINPAWNDALSVIPSELHSQVAPVFSKWDTNVQNKIQEVHSQYEPYKFLLDQGVEADQIQYGLGLIQAIQTDPRGVVEALNTYLLDGAEPQQQQQPQVQAGQQGQFNQPTQPEFDITQHPDFQKMNQVVQGMAQILLTERQAQQEAFEAQQLEQEFEEARKTHGDFDEEYVLALMIHKDMSLDDAISADKARVQQILTQQRKPGPTVLGSSGSFPNTNVSVTDLDDKGRRNLITQMLDQVHNNSA